MAISCRASARSILKLSRSSPFPPRPFFPMAFKPTGTRPLSLEKTRETDTPFLVSGCANWGSLGAEAHPLELPPPLDESPHHFPFPLSISNEVGNKGWWPYAVMWLGDERYKVLLIDDPRHTEKLVTEALPNIIPSITPFKAKTLFDMSRQWCFAVVTTVKTKRRAKFIVQMMTQWGLRSAIQPPSDTY